MKVLAAIALLTASPAVAEVVHADSHGFDVSETVQVPLSAPNALDAFTRVSRWWIKDHTYSGDPANLSLDARPGGCLCERLPGGGGIEHMRVTYFEPGKFLFLTGAMGPLLYEAVTGVMIVHVDPAAEGSSLTIDYRAAGFANGGGDKFARQVDAMLTATINSYRAFANGVAGRP